MSAILSALLSSISSFLAPARFRSNKLIQYEHTEINRVNDTENFLTQIAIEHPVGQMIRDACQRTIRIHKKVTSEKKSELCREHRVWCLYVQI